MPRTALRNPLTRPSVKAGIDLNHIALSNGAACRFAGVARGGSFFDLSRGVSGTIVSTPTRVIDGMTGDSVQYTAAAAHTFANRATTDQKLTFAAIVKWTAIANSTFSFIFANSTSTTGYNAIFGGSDGSVGIRYNATNWTALAGILANNIPYFVAGAVAPSVTTNFVVRRLDNGQTFSSTAGSTTYADSPNGTYVVGNWPSLGTFGLVGRIAAVAYTNGYLAIPQLLQWAAAPWDFWYPPAQQQLIMSAVGQAGSAGAGGTQARVLVMA